MMNQQDIFKKIGSILTELNEQYQFLAKNPQQLNELELELFLANAHFLTEHVEIIRKLNGLSGNLNGKTEVNHFIEQAEKEVVMPEIVDFSTQKEIEQSEIQIQEVEASIERNTFEFILNDGAEVDKFDFEEKSVDEIFDRPLSQAEEEIIAKKKTPKTDFSSEPEELVEDEIGPEPFLVTKKEEPVIIKPEVVIEHKPQIHHRKEKETLAKHTPTLNEMLAKAEQTDNIIAKPPVTDLKQAITLNDKLLYIKDLFNGYNLAYAEAIEIINKMNSFETVDAFLQKSYAAKNNWAAKQGTVDKFYELINRRFPRK